MTPVYQALYNSLSSEEKVIFKLKGERKYFDDLDSETQKVVFMNLMNLERVADRLEQLIKDTQCQQ